MPLTLSDLPKSYYKIKDVTDLLNGLEAQTLRTWEEKDIGINPKRRPDGERRYKPQDILHLQEIMVLRNEKKMSFESISALLKQRKKRKIAKDETIEKLEEMKAWLISFRDSL